MRCRQVGIPVPAIYFVNERAGKIFMSFIDEAVTVRDYLFASRDGEHEE